MTVQTSAPETVEVKVGDFFYSSWGYDQTQVDFYKVVGLTPSGKSVKVQKWSSALAPGTEGGGPQEYVVPGEGPATYVDWSGVDQSADYWTQQEQKVVREVPVETKRLKFWGSTAAFTINSYSGAYLWDGKPQYQTGAGWGH